MPRTCPARLAPADKAMLSDYLDQVDEVDRRLAKMEHQDMGQMQIPDAPAGIPAAFDEHMRMMYDLIALAYQANLTRVASMMVAAEVSNQPYTSLASTTPSIRCRITQMIRRR